jgi:hypothetical protein
MPSVSEESCSHWWGKWAKLRTVIPTQPSLRHPRVLVFFVIPAPAPAECAGLVLFNPHEHEAGVLLAGIQRLSTGCEKDAGYPTGTLGNDGCWFS